MSEELKQCPLRYIAPEAVAKKHIIACCNYDCVLGPIMEDIITDLHDKLIAKEEEIKEQKMMYAVIEQKLNDTCDNVNWYKSELTTKDKEIEALNKLVEALDNSEAHRGNLIVKLVCNRADCTLQKYTDLQNKVTFALARLEEVRERNNEEKV